MIREVHQQLAGGGLMVEDTIGRGKLLFASHPVGPEESRSIHQRYEPHPSGIGG